MAELIYDSNLGVFGSISATNVPNAIGTLLTLSSVDGKTISTRTNAQILSDLGADNKYALKDGSNANAGSTWNINILGNAATVSRLTTSAEGNPINPNSVTTNHIGYTNSVNLFGQGDGGLYSSSHSIDWNHQIFGDFRTGQIAIRGKLAGTWQDWKTVLDSGNYNNYAPTLTGGGAGGSWAINITGNAASATILQTTRQIWGQNFNGSADIVGHGVFIGSGNGYNTGGLEVRGNGPTDTVFPNIGFHQPGRYAAYIQYHNTGEFRFYNTDGSAYVSLRAANIYGDSFVKSGGTSSQVLLANGGVGTIGLNSGQIVARSANNRIDFFSATDYIEGASGALTLRSGTTYLNSGTVNKVYVNSSGMTVASGDLTTGTSSNVDLQILGTGGTAPTTTGSTQMVIVDAIGRLSRQAIPNGGGAANLALGTPTSTTYPITNSNGTGFTLPAATSSYAGLFTAANAIKLADIDSGANYYVLPAATGSTLGGVIVGFGLSISSGVLSATGSTSSGSYTPSISNTTNISSSTAYISYYTRIGSIVTVYGYVQVTPTATGLITSLSLSLPITSNFSSSEDASGSGNSAAGGGSLGQTFSNIVVKSISSSSTVQLSFASGLSLGAGQYIAYSYSYIII